MRCIPLLLGLLLAAPAVRAACPSEATHPNAVEVTEGDLRYVLATSDSHYDPGEPVPILLAVENLGTETGVIQNIHLITPMNSFALVPGPCPTLTPECMDTFVYRYPEGVFFFGTNVNIPPGECHERTGAWDGLSMQDLSVPAPGPYALFGGYGNGYPPVFHQPAGGLRLEITLDPVVPVETVTWGGLKSRYPG